MWKLFCLAILCFLPSAVMQPQEFSADEYITGMTIVGKPRTGPSCPPIVWVVAGDTPAAKAGIQPGDRVLAIDGHPTVGIDTLENFTPKSQRRARLNLKASTVLIAS